MLQSDSEGTYSKLIADQNSRSARNRFPGDDNLIVLFKEDAVPDAAESEKAGYPKYRPADVIQIWVPGDRFNKVEREVTDADKHRFEEKYKKFKAGTVQAEAGLPLEQWPAIHKAMVLELRYFEIRTVEQLANLSDGNASGIGPIQALKQKAIDYLKAAKDGAHLTQMRKEIENRDNELETLRKVVEQQGKRIEEMARNKK
jgi:hypothetical protein